MRTPQDVLRATPREKAIVALAELARWYPEHSLANGLVDDVQAALMDEKAIAEASDSPPLRAIVKDAIWELRHRKPAITDEVMAEVLERAVNEAPDTLSEKPGLEDLDWLMGRVVARFSDSEYHRAKDIILRMAGFPTARALKETVESASTDSEGHSLRTGELDTPSQVEPFLHCPCPDHQADVCPCSLHEHDSEGR